VAADYRWSDETVGVFEVGDGTVLRQLLDFLRDQGAIPAEKIRKRRLSPAERRAQAFERYLREERALAKATISNYVPFVREFLKDCFGMDRPRCRDCMPAMWCDLSSVERLDCI
jgi:hypothetical protein